MMLIYETELPIDASTNRQEIIQICHNWLKRHPVLQTAPHIFMEFRNQHSSLIYPIQCSLNPAVFEQIQSIRFRIPHPQDLPCDFVIDTFIQEEKLLIQLKLQANKDKNSIQALHHQIMELNAQHNETIQNLHDEYERDIAQINEEQQRKNNASTEQHFHEMKEKNKEISDLKREIHNLEQLLEEATQSPNPQHSYTHVKTVVRGSCVLSYGDELDLYNDEILSFVLDALHNELATRTHENSRRKHILDDLLLHNSLTTDLRKEKEAELKRIMRNYQRLDASTLNSLKKLGFSHSQEGTHHKFTFMGDSRYIATTSKSSSDVRSGKNFSHDISNKLF